MDNVGTYMPVRVCTWTEQEHTCVQIIFTLTSFAQYSFCSNPLRSHRTGSRGQGQPSQQACVPLVIQVFEFAACEGIQASM